MHDQRHRRACRQRGARRDRDGGPHPAASRGVPVPREYAGDRADQPAAVPRDRRLPAAQQGDRRPQRVRARSGHPPARRAAERPDLRDHRAGDGRRRPVEHRARQTFGAPCARAPLPRPRLRARCRHARAALSGVHRAGRQETADPRRGPAHAAARRLPARARGLQPHAPARDVRHRYRVRGGSDRGPRLPRPARDRDRERSDCRRVCGDRRSGRENDRSDRPVGAVGHARSRQPGARDPAGARRRQITQRSRRLDRYRRSRCARACPRAEQGGSRGRPGNGVAQQQLLLGGLAMSLELLTGAQILCRTLVDAGVEVMFGYPGGAIMPFYDALHGHAGLRHILVRHEQAAAHAADGYARASGRVGVCVATSGPGVTNLVTGLATAHMDGSPVVAITGQVGRPMLGRDAFQETDVVGVTMSVTKHNVLVRDIEELADDVRDAFAIAMEGRPGPVLVDVPKDVQNQKAEYRVSGVRDQGSANTRHPTPDSRFLDDDAIQQTARLIAEAKRPLLMIGRGVIVSGAYAEVRELAERTGTPVITTLLGISAFPQAHDLHLGMPGMHGEVHINKAIQAADLIVGIGMRFDDRVTGNTATFAPRAKIVHIDIDGAAIGRTVHNDVGLVGDARSVLQQLLAEVGPRDCLPWREEIAALMRQREEAFAGGLSPEVILSALAEVTGGHCTVVSDVGQHQMWVAQRYPFQRPNTHITSGGLGAMGFAVPAAMGVRLARPGEPVWAISGDGGFQMNMAEMATMVQEGVEVKIAIFNNGYLGMVRQWQQFFHGGRYSNTPIWSPDYVKLADAYGIPGYRVENASDLADVVGKANAVPGPALVEFVIEQEANVFPMIPPGGSLSEPIEAAV